MTPHGIAYDPAKRLGMTPEEVASHIKAQPKVDSAQPKGEAVTNNKNFTASAKWGAVGILAFAVVVVAFKWGPPAVAVDAPDRWTGTDQIRFETALGSRLDRMDRLSERIETLIVSNGKIIERLLTLTERQDERLKALEEWRKGLADGEKPAPVKPKKE